jgi:hypothetical protein
MRVKQSEIRTNGPWRMRTGHANGMRWIPGRRAVVHVKAWKTWEMKNTWKREMWNTQKRETRKICVCAKCELCEMCKMHEKREMLITWKRTRYVSARNANCVGSRNVKMRGIWMWNAWQCKVHENAKHEMREICEMCETCEIAKIAKVTALQQVQYKVLQYGLYAPIETWVSTLFFS